MSHHSVCPDAPSKCGFFRQEDAGQAETNARGGSLNLAQGCAVELGCSTAMSRFLKDLMGVPRMTVEHPGETATLFAGTLFLVVVFAVKCWVMDFPPAPPDPVDAPPPGEMDR